MRLQEWPFKGVTRVIYYLCKWSDSNPTSSWWLVPQPIWKNMLVKFGPLFPGFGANIRKIFELPPPKTNLNWHFQAPLSGTSKGSFGPTDLSIPPTKTFKPSPKFSVQPSYNAAGRASGLSWSSSGLRPPNQPTNRQQDTNGWVNEGMLGSLKKMVHFWSNPPLPSISNSHSHEGLGWDFWWGPLCNPFEKNICQNRNLPQIMGVKIKNIWPTTT